MVCMGDCAGSAGAGDALTWNKRYITLAPIATVLGLAFKLSDPDRLLGGEEELGITCALIPTSTPGVKSAVATSAERAVPERSNPRQRYLRAYRLHHRRPKHGWSGLAHAG